MAIAQKHKDGNVERALRPLPAFTPNVGSVSTVADICCVTQFGSDLKRREKTSRNCQNRMCFFQVNWLVGFQPCDK